MGIFDKKPSEAEQRRQRLKEEGEAESKKRAEEEAYNFSAKVAGGNLWALEVRKAFDDSEPRQINENALEFRVRHYLLFRVLSSPSSGEILFDWKFDFSDPASQLYAPASVPKRVLIRDQGRIEAELDKKLSMGTVIYDGEFSEYVRRIKVDRSGVRHFLIYIDCGGWLSPDHPGKGVPMAKKHFYFSVDFATARSSDDATPYKATGAIYDECEAEKRKIDQSNDSPETKKRKLDQLTRDRERRIAEILGTEPWK